MSIKGERIAVYIRVSSKTQATRSQELVFCLSRNWKNAPFGLA
jgi:hypothetical protein